MERLTEWIPEEHKAIPRIDLRSNGYERCATRLAEYEDTGLTPKQVQQLKERDTAKIPHIEGDGCDNNGNIIYDTWICPNCKEYYEVEYDDYDFCPKCGQKIDLSELNN